MRWRTTLPLVLAVSLAAGTALAAPAAADDAPEHQERAYALGGVSLGLPGAGGPGPAAAAATCLPPMATPPVEPSAEAPSLGGACFDVAGVEDQAVEVAVRDALVTAPPTSIAFAAGYDLDGDGCVGCTTEDRLWQALGTETVPVPEEADTLAVFVYGLGSQAPFGEPPMDTRPTVAGTVDIAPAGAHPCVPLPGPSGADCGEVLAPEPHVCLPDCSIVAP
jgi:hypothetical protein